MAACDTCQARWLVEACDLASGRVRTIWQPISIDWEQRLNQVGKGSVTLPTKAIGIRDVWPGLTSVYISRIEGADGASRTNPVCEYAGIVVEVGASESNVTTVGLKSIEHYLERRFLDTSVAFNGVEQTVIARDLVRRAENNGIPLYAEADASTIERDRQYEPWNRKFIGEAVMELTQVLNGPDWEIQHARSGGLWSSTMIFRDVVGVDRGVIIKSDIQATAYSMSIDQSEQATRVDGIGSGEEEDQLVAEVADNTGIYPRFDAAPAWKDVTRLNTLYQHADGYLEDHREPDARPTVSLSGFDPDPSLVRVGDVVEIDIDFGAITYHGKVRVISISWSLSGDETENRTLEVVPLDRASQTILNQEPSDDNCPDC